MMPTQPTSPSRLFTFVGGTTGTWSIDRIDAVIGEPIAFATNLAIVPESLTQLPAEAVWGFRGIISNERYVEREEKTALVSKQEGLGRPESKRAALIPIRKTPAWWALAQDERRHIFEAQSRHIGVGMQYLPAIARRLHHCRDLNTAEPFDFLTWFEYASSDTPAFEELLTVLRTSPEWAFVDREVDIRLIKQGE